MPITVAFATTVALVGMWGFEAWRTRQHPSFANTRGVHRKPPDFSRAKTARHDDDDDDNNDLMIWRHYYSAQDRFEGEVGVW